MGPDECTRRLSAERNGPKRYVRAIAGGPQPDPAAEAAVWHAVGRLYPGVEAGDLTLADALASLARLRPALDHTTHTVVREARADGASWAEIGTVLGVTAQAAHQRFRTSAAAD